MQHIGHDLVDGVDVIVVLVPTGERNGEILFDGCQTLRHRQHLAHIASGEDRGLGTYPAAEGVLVVANLLWVLLAVGGGLLLATTQYPSWWEPIARFLPTGALGDGLRSALTGSGPLALPLVVLVIWGAVLTFAASRLFRWSD